MRDALGCGARSTLIDTIVATAAAGSASSTVGPCIRDHLVGLSDDQLVALLSSAPSAAAINEQITTDCGD